MPPIPVSAPSMGIRLEALAVELGGAAIIDHVGFFVRSGEISGLIGPNGSGKTTLLRTLYRHLRPAQGVVSVGDTDLWALSARENARRVAAVPQERSEEFDFTVREVVAMGRLPHVSPLRSMSADRSVEVDEAMARTGVAEFAARSFSTLSGGERQRVLVARALAQSAPVIVLDEPTNHLDVRHQLEVLELLRELRLTTLMAIHDLNLAAAYCDVVHVLDGGQLRASGPPAEVLTPDLVEAVFKVRCTRHIDAAGVLRLTFSPLPATR